jgi:hypothetical protein
MHDSRSFTEAKRTLLGDAGLLVGHADMPTATIVMVEAAEVGEDYQADNTPDKLRAMADCMERYTAEKVSELRKLADALDRDAKRTRTEKR